MMYRMKVRINKYLEVRDDTMKEITMFTPKLSMLMDCSWGLLNASADRPVN